MPGAWDQVGLSCYYNVVSKWTSFIAVEEREEGEYDDPAALDLSLQVDLVAGIFCECVSRPIFGESASPVSRLTRACQSHRYTEFTLFTFDSTSNMRQIRSELEPRLTHVLTRWTTCLLQPTAPWMPSTTFLGNRCAGTANTHYHELNDLSYPKI